MRKIIVLAVVAICLLGCTTKSALRKVVYVIDYSKYSDAGFFITESNSVSFDYKPIGSVTVVVANGYEVLSADTVFYKYNTYPTIAKINVKYGDYKILGTKDAMDLMRDEVIRMGGNGVINLKIIPDPNFLSHTVEGMAIKK